MLAEQVDKWERDLLTRGREEGREEGKNLAMREILRGQIVQKFGQAAWERSQFQVQSFGQSEQLQKACERLLVVNSVEELFED